MTDWNKPYEMTFDLILCTASSDEGFDLAPYLSLLKVHGRFIAVGLPEGAGWQVKPQNLLANGCLIGSSHLGSRKESWRCWTLPPNEIFEAGWKRYPSGKKDAVKRVSAPRSSEI